MGHKQPQHPDIPRDSPASAPASQQFSSLFILEISASLPSFSTRGSPQGCRHAPPIHPDWEAGLNQPHTCQGPGIASLPSPGCQGARPCTRPVDSLFPRCLHTGLKGPLPSPSHFPGASSPPPHCTLTKHFKCTNAAIPVRLWQGRHYHLRFSAERPRDTRQVTCQQPEPGRGVG